jgi:ankyrin repeat protein
VEEVQALLEYGSNTIDLVNQGDYDNRTALHLAAGEGHLEIVKMLCEAGANVNVEDRWKNRPLDDAENAKKNSQQIMTVLTQYGAKSKKNPSLLSRLMSMHVVPDDRDAKESVTYLATQSAKYRTGKQKIAAPITMTVAYSPPELFTDNATPTPATDMWAVGVIMYSLLTGS